jgi:hypothetical protein
MDVKSAIRNGDAENLSTLLAEDPTRANVLIRWGGDQKNLTHPLHFVCDMLFQGKLKRGSELPLIDALIRAGADLDFQRNGNGDTPLIGAASLATEEVGIRLVDAGANPKLLGIFQETALHWAALLGEDRLAQRLIPISDIDLKDAKYLSPPVGWAIHGCYENPKGNQGRQRQVVSLLVAAGATVEPKWLQSDHVRSDSAMLAVLSKSPQNPNPT